MRSSHMEVPQKGIPPDNADDNDHKKDHVEKQGDSYFFSFFNFNLKNNCGNRNNRNEQKSDDGLLKKIGNFIINLF
jgi:hypothetical protein